MRLSSKLIKFGGTAALAALVLGMAGPADASPVPPTADSSLLGTWVNTDSGSLNVKQVVVAPLRNGSVSVDAFGACSPTLCEWGKVPAIVYGTDVSAKSGATFQTRQRFLSGGVEWSRTTLLGSVILNDAGAPTLTLRELTVFEDGSGRHNYEATDTFVPGTGQPATANGLSVAGYAHGAPPALDAGAFGSWVNTTSGALAGLKITGTLAAPKVDAFGQCSPSPCDWGIVRSTNYGPSPFVGTGETTFAAYKFAFKKAQLVITYSVSSDSVEHLTVAEYNEFTDGSGRSNYAMTETFVRG